MSNLQPNCCLKIDFQKVDQHAGGQWLIHDAKRHKTISCKTLNSPAEYPSWVARCEIKGSDGTMLNPIFWKKDQGQKHPGRRGIVKHQIPSIKVLFKINFKSSKHPGIKLLSSESKTHSMIVKGATVDVFIYMVYVSFVEIKLLINTLTW